MRGRNTGIWTPGSWLWKTSDPQGAKELCWLERVLRSQEARRSPLVALNDQRGEGSRRF